MNDNFQQTRQNGIRIVVVDDHDLVRAGIQSLIETGEGLRVVGEASNGAEALEVIRNIKPDVVVMDANMPVMDGIEATRALKKEFPDLAVIALSVNAGAHVAQAMLEAGASSYVYKDQAPADLLDVIHRYGNPSGNGN